MIDSMFKVANEISKGMTNHDFCYCLEEGKFYIYKNGYWKQLADLEIMALILECYSGREGFINITQFTVSKRMQILDNLKQLIFKRLEVFNKSGFLNFDQGEYDPVTDVLHPHLMSNYSTLRMPYPYEPATIGGMDNPDARCELWVKTLLEVFEGDQDKVDILQEFFGYCLTKDTSQRKALLLIGESNCGKSTILWTLRNMLGENNCSAVSIQNINNPQYTANLMNKLVNIDTDVSQDARSYEEQFKKIAGGEAVGCNPKYIAPFEFLPYSRIVMGSNGFPRVTDHSEAFFNRLIMIPCDRVFQEEEQNKNLPVELKAELPGIFNWAVKGLHRLRARGRFEIKDFMKQAKQDLRDESNPIDVFFRETIEIDKKSIISRIVKQELYSAYCEWCRLNGNAPMSAIKFGKAVYQKYSRVTEKNSKDANGIAVWRNLKLKEKEIPEDTREAGWPDE